MISRFKYVPMPKRDTSKDDVFIRYKLVKQIKVLSTNKDGSVDKYVESSKWVEEKSSWKDFIKSYDLGSVSEQMINHLTKGTPLVTAHTLPAGDYTSIGRGAEIKREMAEKGITLEMIYAALLDKAKSVKAPKSKESKEGDPSPKPLEGEIKQ